MMARRVTLFFLAIQPLGWPGAVGVVCIGLALAVAALVQPRWDTQTADLQTQVDQLSRRQRAAKLRVNDPSNVALLATPKGWVASLPHVSQRQKRLANLLDLATQQGLTVVRTEHRVTTDAASGLERLRVSMPVKGNYAQVRALISAALAADSALSLDALKLRRGNALEAEIDADLQWSLHSRRGGAQ